MIRSRLRTCLLVVVLAVMLLPAAPARAAVDLRLVDRVPVAPGLLHEIYRYRVGGGPVHVEVLRFALHDPRLRLEPELGGGQVQGMEATHQATARLGQSAVAGVNASFHLPGASPWGDPLGLFLSSGRYASQPERGTVWRGAFGIRPDDTYLVGNPGYLGRLVLPDGTTVPLDGVGRHPTGPTPERPQHTEITLLPPSFGARTGTPAGTVEVVVRNAQVAPASVTTVPVSQVSDTGNVPIPSDGYVLAVAGRRANLLRALAPGDPVTVRLEIATGWENLQHAVQGGPLLLKDGRPTSHASWELEGFNPSVHNDRRHPRTLVGFTPDRRMLLVTVDGRQPGYSVGVTLAEAAALMQALGAVDAVSMDGGGSTTMAVNDRIANRPCCDRPGFRRVSSHLIVHTVARAQHVRRLGGRNAYATAAEIARAGWPDGAGTVVLASGRTFADGLSGGPLAHRVGGPLLLTEPDRLPPETAQALDELRPRQVLVLGGPVAISDGVLEHLARHGHPVRRLAGQDRVHTARVIAGKLGAPTQRAFLAASHSFPDSLSAAVPAALAGAPLLLTASDRLSPEAALTLRQLGVRAVSVVGGPAAVSDQVLADLRRGGYDVTRIAGADRYGTSAAAATWAVQHGRANSQAVALATGEDFPGALAGGPLAAKERKPLLLVNPLELKRSPASLAWLQARDLRLGTIFGGRSQVSTWVALELDARLRP